MCFMLDVGGRVRVTRVVVLMSASPRGFLAVLYVVRFLF